MFNYQRIVNEKSKYEKEATQRMILIYQVIIVFSIIFILSFIFFKKEQNRKKRFAHLKEEQYKRSQQYIEDNEKQISQLTEMLRSKQEEMGEVEKQLYEARKLMLEMENRQILKNREHFFCWIKIFITHLYILGFIGRMTYNLVQMNGKNYIN